MLKAIRLFSIVTLGLFLTGCGDPDKVRFNIKMPLAEKAQLSAEAQPIWDSLQAGKEISFKQITDALAHSHDSHYTDSKSRTAQLFTMLDDAQKSALDGDFSKRKVQYEEWLTKQKGAATIYNVEAITIFHYLLENKMQCYSGTFLNQLINRKSVSGGQFQKENWVAIYESGHILSGYLKEVNGVWNLFGIETTAEGLALIEYGPVDGITIDIRVVDADYWALTELFKFYLSDAIKTGNEVIVYTAKRYGIKNPKVITEVSAITKVNQSPFAFGTADVSSGDKKRGRFDSRKRSGIFGGNPNPNLSRYAEEDAKGNIADREALVESLTLLIKSKASRNLTMPSGGEFCAAMRGSSGSYSSSSIAVCTTSGGLVSTLERFLGYEFRYHVSVDAMNELRRAIIALP